MTETSNYHLYLEDDETTHFIDWRQKMNGGTGSNIEKIDTALGEKADKSVELSSTILAASWTGEEAPFLQTLAVPGITKETNGMINFAHGATTEQRDAARGADLAVIGQSDGELTISADGDLPTVDIPVSIILFG
jgi:hypothetical protein